MASHVFDLRIHIYNFYGATMTFKSRLQGARPIC